MKAISKMFLLIFCLTLTLNNTGIAQVKIKERVEINSLTGKNNLRNTYEDYPPILINVGSPSSSFDVTATGPAGSVSSSGGTDNHSIDISLPAANGSYYITVYVFVSAGGINQTSYSAVWNGISLGYETHYVSNTGNDTDAIIPTTFSFTFNNIPELYDFSVNFEEDEICGAGESGIRLSYSSNIQAAAEKSVNISLSDGGTNAVLYDKINHTDLGISTTTTIEKANNLSLKIDSLYIGDTDANVIVTGEVDGMIRSDTILVLTAKEYLDYIIEVWPDEPTTVKHNLREWLDAYAWNGGCGTPQQGLANNIKYNVKITKGEQYGYLSYMPEGWEITQRGTELNNLDHDYGSLYLWYNSFGDISAETDTVVVNVSTTDPEIEPKDINLLVEPNPLTVYVEPNPVFVGDTAKINIKHFLDTGVIIDFPPDQLFYVGIDDGNEYGDIYSSAREQTDEYFWDTPGEFSFIAANSIDSDSAFVFLYVDTYIEGDGTISTKINMNKDSASDNQTREEKRTKIRNMVLENRKIKSRIKNDHAEVVYKKDNVTIRKNDKGKIISGVMGDGLYIWAELEIVVVNTMKNKIKIMLGETKYLGVKKREEEGIIKEIKIEEIPVEVDATPSFPTCSDGWLWIKDKTIWAERPIDIQVKGESPIFYDYFYANIYYTGAIKPAINNLDDGMIRIVGRYLNKTEGNRVLLSTNAYESILPAIVEIEVMKPTKLGEGQPLSVVGPTKIDNVDKTYNVDSLLIEISGKLGLLPQLLRALIEKESGAYPVSYRYEPYYDMNNVQKHFNSNNRYWIESEDNLGIPVIPKHNNIEDALGPIDNYPGYVTVWDIYTAKTGLYSFDIPAYSSYKEKWNRYKKMWADSLLTEGLSKNVVRDSCIVLADISYSKFLRFEIGGKGMDGTPAQTRISASYGLMQQVYACAIGSYNSYWGLNYPDNNSQYLPEYLMIPDINIEYSSKHILGKLRLILGPIVYTAEDTWPKDYALELSYWSCLLKYNGGKDNTYPNSVLRLMNNYLPRRN